MIELPEDIVRYIISFAFDRRGYNTIEYEKRKKYDIPRMKRIILELMVWKKMKTSICWLKPSRVQRKRTRLFKNSFKEGKPIIVYHTGVYSHEHQETKRRREQQRFEYWAYEQIQ